MIDYRTFQPLSDRIVVQLVPDIREHLLVPEVAQQRSHVGLVIAIGPGKRDQRGRLRPMDVKPGDLISFSLNDHEDGDYTIIRQDDVRGFLTAPSN